MKTLKLNIQFFLILLAFISTTNANLVYMGGVTNAVNPSVNYDGTKITYGITEVDFDPDQPYEEGINPSFDYTIINSRNVITNLYSEEILTLINAGAVFNNIDVGSNSATWMDEIDILTFNSSPVTVLSYPNNISDDTFKTMSGDGRNFLYENANNGGNVEEIVVKTQNNIISNFPVSFGSSTINNDGTVIAIGEWYDGEVKIYKFYNFGWGQIGQTLTGYSNSGGGFGKYISLSDDGYTIAVTSEVEAGEFGLSQGSVYVYQFDGTSWNQKGSTLWGDAYGDRFGGSVAISGDGLTLMAGRRLADDAGNNFGQARIFHYDSAAEDWSVKGAYIDGQTVNGYFGTGVSASYDGNIISVSGWGEHVSRVYEYIDSSDSWSQVGDDIASEDASVSGDGSVVVVRTDGFVGGAGFTGFEAYYIDIIRNSQLGYSAYGKSVGSASLGNVVNSYIQIVNTSGEQNDVILGMLLEDKITSTSNNLALENSNLLVSVTATSNTLADADSNLQDALNVETVTRVSEDDYLQYQIDQMDEQIYELIVSLQALSTRVTTLETSSTSGGTVTEEMVQDGRVGSTAFAVHNNTASIQMNLETTSNLTEGAWSPSTNVNIVIPVNGESTQFFRMDFE